MAVFSKQPFSSSLPLLQCLKMAAKFALRKSRAPDGVFSPRCPLQGQGAGEWEQEVRRGH